jgi:hypothetical protein
MDARTTDYFRELNKITDRIAAQNAHPTHGDPRTRDYLIATKKAMDADSCTCQKCLDSRVNGNPVSPCNANKLQNLKNELLFRTLSSKVIQPYPDNYLPKLSKNPSDWFFAEQRKKRVI